MLFSKVRLRRYILFIFSLIVWSAAGIYYTGLNSIIDLIHFLSVPLLVSYLLIFKPEIIRKKIVPYCIFLAIITLLAAGYLIVFSQSIPHIRINWVELPIAVYFLLSVYVILWLLDKFINLIGSTALRINQKTGGTAAKNAVKNGLRFTFLIFAVIPYLVAVFTTHWIKFAGADSPKKLPDLEYRRVCFNTGDGAKLDGWFILSTTGMSDSAVIIAPGRSPTKNLFLPYARVLSKNGYNVLLFDLRGNGNSSGHKYSFGINEANDILGAVDYLETRHAESSRYIFGFGINEGASALIAAAGRDDRFAGVVIDSTSGYEVSMPGWLSDYLPGWMEKALLKVTRSVITIDIGQTAWGAEKLYKDISQISPCPVLVTNSLKTDKPGRIRTIELYTKAKEPKMLWLTPPPTDEEQNIGLEKEYFQNILELFDFGRAKQQPGCWRISHSGYGAKVSGTSGRKESPLSAGRVITL
jgi:pimeloyl-ACP methyl ester carboxylesterase